MPSSRSMGLVVVLGGITAAGIARAQQAPVGAPPPSYGPAAPAPNPPAAPGPAAPAQYAPPPSAPAPVAPAPFVGAPNAEADPRGATATGFMVQARMQAQSSLLSLGGGPGFLVGYHGASFSLGLGVGLTRLGFSSKDSGSSSGSVSLIQVVPTLMIDVWHSADGRARANLIGGLGYERASGSVTSDSTRCVVDAFGTTRCSTISQTDSVGATLIPVMIGVGGDYFFSRNFALGAEGGFQAAFLTSVDSTSNNSSQTFDTTGDMEFAYGVFRATIVLGD